MECNYNKELNDYIKSIHGRKFDIITTRWTLPLNSFDGVMSKVNMLEYEVKPLKQHELFPSQKKAAKFIQLE